MMWMSLPVGRLLLLLWAGLAAAILSLGVGVDATVYGPYVSSSELLNVSTCVSAPGPLVAWNNPESAQARGGPAAVSASNLPTATSQTNSLVCSGFGHVVPAGCEVEGVEVTVRARTSANGDLVEAKDVFIARGAVRAAKADLNQAFRNSGFEDKTYGNTADLWGHNWTAAEVSAADFTTAVVFRGYSGGNDNQPGRAEVDLLSTSVYFSADAQVTSLSPLSVAASSTATLTINGRGFADLPSSTGPVAGPVQCRFVQGITTAFSAAAVTSPGTLTCPAPGGQFSSGTIDVSATLDGTTYMDGATLSLSITSVPSSASSTTTTTSGSASTLIATASTTTTQGSSSSAATTTTTTATTTTSSGSASSASTGAAKDSETEGEATGLDLTVIIAVVVVVIVVCLIVGVVAFVVQRKRGSGGSGGGTVPVRNLSSDDDLDMEQGMDENEETVAVYENVGEIMDNIDESASASEDDGSSGSVVYEI